MFAIILLDSAMYKIDFLVDMVKKILSKFVYFWEWFNKFKSVTTKTQFKSHLIKIFIIIHTTKVFENKV